MPLLLDRGGERSALEELAYQGAPGVAPLVQITPPGLRDGAEQAQPPEMWAAALARKIGAAPIYLDVAGAKRRTAADRPLSAAATAIVLDAAGLGGMRFAPVYPVGTPQLAGLVRRVAAEHGMGAALRVVADGLAVPSGRTLAEVVAGEGERLGLAAGGVDLILDLGYLDANLELNAASVGRILDPLAAVAPWRSVVLAAGSVPETLSTAVADGMLGGIRRLEWPLWLELRRSRPWLRFGDYGVQNPIPPDPGSAPLMRASIRYTAGDHMLAVRGERPVLRMNREEKEAEYRGLAARIYQHPSFVECCAADRFIIDCADGRTVVLAQQGWRRVATLHHLCTVAALVASEVASSEAAIETLASPAASRGKRATRREERVRA